MNAEDKQQQQEAVFYALNNADNGEVVEWFNVKNNTQGKVKPVQTYPQGSGYCRTLFSAISVKNKSRTFTETACIEGGHEGWRFIRK
jgi:surface antigen